MTNKKTKIIFTTVIFALVLSVACVILFFNKRGNDVNSSEEVLPAHYVEHPTLTVSNGKFYYNGDTDSIYYDVQDGSMQLIFTEEKYKKYLRESSGNWSEDEIDNSYKWNLEFWENPRPCKIWVLYSQSPEPDDLFLSFETFDIELGDEIVPAPGGGWKYIDENNFGSVGGKIFTRVPE